MTSPLERALQAVPNTGWGLRSLSKSPFNSSKPWSCELWPMHLGRYYYGTKAKDGLYGSYIGGQKTVIGEGATALDAVKDALSKLDKCPAKALYEQFEIALEDWLDASNAAGDR